MCPKHSALHFSPTSPLFAAPLSRLTTQCHPWFLSLHKSKPLPNLVFSSITFHFFFQTHSYCPSSGPYLSFGILWCSLQIVLPVSNSSPAVKVIFLQHRFHHVSKLQGFPRPIVIYYIQITTHSHFFLLCTSCIVLTLAPHRDSNMLGALDLLTFHQARRTCINCLSL